MIHLPLRRARFFNDQYSGFSSFFFFSSIYYTYRIKCLSICRGGDFSEGSVFDYSGNRLYIGNRRISRV